jgi:hypothetical protein
MLYVKNDYMHTYIYLCTYIYIYIYVGIYILAFFKATSAGGGSASASLALSPRIGVGARGGLASRYSVYLLYWYKSTNTDAECAASPRSPLTPLAFFAACPRVAMVASPKVLYVLALLVQKYTY